MTFTTDPVLEMYQKLQNNSNRAKLQDMTESTLPGNRRKSYWLTALNIIFIGTSKTYRHRAVDIHAIYCYPCKSEEKKNISNTCILLIFSNSGTRQT